MTTKVLSVLSDGYRATVEEQDDTVLWFTSMCAKDLDMAVLLESDAVNYPVRTENVADLILGGRKVADVPRLDRDVDALMTKGVTVSYLAEDLIARGIDESRLIDGVKPVARAELPALFEQFDQIWHW
jgi:sulfur transfer complex TusBCD TusB component (DsrH family)